MTTTNQALDFHLQLIKEIEDQKIELRSGFEAVVLLLHLATKRLGFRCVGTRENSRSEEGVDLFVPEGWNQSEDCYVFTYKHAKSSMTFVIKSLVMGQSLLINGTALEDKKVHSFEIDLLDHIRKGADMRDYNNIYKDTRELLRSYKVNVLDKLLPGINKDGYDTSNHNQNTTQHIRDTSTPDPLRVDPLRVDPLRVDPLRVDPLRDDRGYRGGGVPPYFPIGGGDLHPDFGGIHIPSIPGIGGGYNGGGSHVGPQHPIFGNPSRDPYYQDDNSPLRRPPPGARFDPYGPPMGNHFRGPNPDDFPPPGFGGNMFI